MSNVLAISPAAKEAVERLENEIMKEQFRSFVSESPEVKIMMVERARELISKMSAFDITYHGRFHEAIADILKQPDVQEALSAATKRVLLDTGNNLNYQIVQATGEYLAGRITMKLPDSGE